MSQSTILSSADPPGCGLLRQRPERVTLGVRPGVVADGRPPVRIFLGTQDEQYRAERVFFYSIEQVRDPGRVYEIYLMKDLAGYARKGWRTGFTNYRFAIPDYADRQGKAIYNDVDQIYTADPAQLYDLELDGHGYRAVSANDTSVMLLDCARMAAWWNLEAATSETKEALLAKVVDEPGLWAPLDGGWNARDLEFVPGRSMLLHFTAMHTQPWHPFPKDYSYHEHPLGDVWHRLERAADAEDYQVFTRSQPSPAFERLLEIYRRGQNPQAAPEPLAIDAAARLMSTLQVKSVLHVSLGIAAAPAIDSIPPRQQLDLALPGATWPVDQTDAVIASQLLERVPGDDVPWLLDQLFRSTRRFVYIAVRCFEAGAVLADGGEQNRSVRDANWWREQVAKTAARYLHVAWRLDAVSRNRQGSISTVAYQPSLAGTSGDPAPRVWILVGHRAGDRAQLLGLAEALGWPFEIKQLAYNPLHNLPNLMLGATIATLDRRCSAPLAPPWPDIVVDCGKRSVPVARWIRDQSGNRTRWVHLGRPWAPIELVDLVISTPQYRLLPRPNVLVNAAPLHRVTSQRLTEAAAAPATWTKLPRPWIGLLVGGDSPPYVFDARTAARLGIEASAAAKAAGGALLVTTSGRTRPAAVSALFGAITAPAQLHRWQAGATDNPYHAILASADSLIVTGDSASMLAEACAAGKPVALFELPQRPSLFGRTLAAIERLFGSHRSRANYRGMPKQQDVLARTFDRLIERGWFMPPRDLPAYHRVLMDRGLVQLLGSPPPATPRRPLDDAQRAVIRVRQLMAADRRVD